MPFVFVSGKFSTKVDLPNDEDFTYGEWTDKKLAKQRKEYEQPNMGLWFEFVDADDETKTYPVPLYENDVYDGSLAVVQSGRSFTFSFDGKAKVNVHKNTKALIDSGQIPPLTSVSLNGQGYGVDQTITGLAIQSKKP